MSTTHPADTWHTIGHDDSHGTCDNCLDCFPLVDLTADWFCPRCDEAWTPPPRDPCVVCGKPGDRGDGICTSHDLDPLYRPPADARRPYAVVASERAVTNPHRREGGEA